MTLYTKSIHQKSKPEDGFRICVMRFLRPYYSYDEWLPDLAPSKELWKKYHIEKSISWKEFEKEYKKDVLEKQKDLIGYIVKMALKKDVTLLCSEKTPEKCHRRLLAEACKSHSPNLEVILDREKNEQANILSF